MQIGSVIWRLMNYGFFATLKYIETEKLFKSKSKNLKNSYKIIKDPHTFINELNSKLKCEIKAEEVLDKVDSFVGLWTNNKSPDISEFSTKDVKSLVGTKTRLIAILSIIASRRFSSLMETGTQFGTTSSLVGYFNNLYQLTAITFDVAKSPIIMPQSSVEYRNLKWPVRSNFKKISKSLKLRNLIFFHDSDHSYENMKFEYNWAWNVLNCESLISDDINANNAFIEFVNLNNLRPIILQFDSGPLVGIIIREKK